LLAPDWKTFPTRAFSPVACEIAERRAVIERRTGMKRYVSFALAAMLAVASNTFVTGCRHEGPAERAGKKIDDATDKLKDKLDPPGPAEKAGRKIDRTLDND
jgi:hypothetical protein